MTPKGPRKSRKAVPPKARNPEARALRSGAFKPKVEQSKDAYQRNPKHRKQTPDTDAD